MKQLQKRIPPSISVVLSIFCLLFITNLQAQQTELEKKVGKSITLDANKKPIGEAPIFTGADGIPRYKTKVLDNKTGNATPSIGLQIDF